MPLTETTRLEARVVLPFWSRALNDDELAATFAQLMDHWGGRIRRHLAEARMDSELAEVDDDVVVDHLLTLLNGVQALSQLSPGLGDSARQRRMIDDYLASLGCPRTDRNGAGPRQDEDVDHATPVAFADAAVRATAARMPATDVDALRTVLLLYRAADAVAYDLESTVHRPAGWSWSGFALAFVLWVDGPTETRRVAERTGMSRAAVSALATTLAGADLLERSPDPTDRRGVVLDLTDDGRENFERTLRRHQERAARWVHLLPADERAVLDAALRRLAAGSTSAWVSRR